MRSRKSIPLIAWTTGCAMAAALMLGGCGNDDANSSAAAPNTTSGAPSTASTTTNTKEALLLKTPGFDQQLKVAVPPDKRPSVAPTKTPGRLNPAGPAALARNVTPVKSTKSSRSARAGGKTTGLSPAEAPAAVAAFGNALIKAKARPHVTIVTNKGSFVIEVEPDGVPSAAGNFVALAANHYYDGIKFHRYVADFVIQGGDPDGTGNGGPGYTIPDEDGPLVHDVGNVAMAKTSAPNSAGSQFYVVVGEAHFLDHKYTVFGKVIQGMDVVQQLRMGDVMKKVTVTGIPATLHVPNPVHKA